MPKMGWAETAIVRARRTSISFVRDQRVATIRISIQKDDNKRTDIDVVISPIQTKMAPGTSSTTSPMMPRLKQALNRVFLSSIACAVTLPWVTSSSGGIGPKLVS